MPALQYSRSRFAAGFAASVTANAWWGLIPVYWKLFSEAGNWEATAHRVVWSSLFLILVIAASGKTGEFASECRAATADRVKRWLLPAAALFAGLNWFVNIIGVTSGHVLELSAGTFLTPLLTVFFGVVFFRERLSAGKWLSLAIAGAGVLAMVGGAGRFPWIAIGVSLTWACYGALKKRLQMNPWFSIAAESIILTPMASAFLLWTAWTGEGSFAVPGSLVLSLLFISEGIVTSIPMLTFSFGANVLPMSILGFLQYINPALQLVLGACLYGEPLGGAKLAAFVLIWFSIVLFTACSVREAAAARRAAAGLPLAEGN